MLSALLIGAGGIAWKHAEALTKLGVSVAYVYDIQTERAKQLAEAYHGQATENLKAAIAAVQLVYILTPPSKRVKYVEMVMKARKAVFIEKPIAATLEDAEEIVRLCENHRIPCMVGFTQRFRPGYQVMQKIIRSGEIGKITQAVSLRIGPGPGFKGSLADSWRTDKNLVCGMAIESLSHDIDFLQSFAGDITEVYGAVKGTIKELPAFDNNADALLRFESGAIGTITASWSSAVAYNIKGVIGEKGSVFLQGDDIWDSTRLLVATKEKTYEEELKDIFNEGTGYLEESRYFIERVRMGKMPVCDVRTGKKVLEVSYQILRNKTERQTAK